MTTIRFARAEDAAGIAAVYAPHVTESATSFELTPPTAEDFEKRMATVVASAPWLVCEAQGFVKGYAYASRHHERAAYRWSIDSAVYVHAKHQRQGIGRALYTALFGLARLQGYCAVHAGVTLPNPASVGLHVAFGFQPVALYPAVGYKLGAWRDVGVWQLELRERRTEPTPPLTPEAAEDLYPPEWAAALEAGRRLLRPSV